MWLAIRRGNATGLGIYRELINREKRSIASWDRQYGPKALLENPDPREMQNLGKMQKFASMPMPLSIQLEMLQANRKKQAAEILAFEKKTFPTTATYPVSALSVSFYGDSAWHTQKPDGRTPPGHPGTFEALGRPKPEPWNETTKFDVNGTLYDKVRSASPTSPPPRRPGHPDARTPRRRTLHPERDAPTHLSVAAGVIGLRPRAGAQRSSLSHCEGTHCPAADQEGGRLV